MSAQVVSGVSAVLAHRGVGCAIVVGSGVRAGTVDDGVHRTAIGLDRGLPAIARVADAVRRRSITRRPCSAAASSAATPTAAGHAAGAGTTSTGTTSTATSIAAGIRGGIEGRSTVRAASAVGWTSAVGAVGPAATVDRPAARSTGTARPTAVRRRAGVDRIEARPRDIRAADAEVVAVHANEHGGRATKTGDRHDRWAPWCGARSIAPCVRCVAPCAAGATAIGETPGIGADVTVVAPTAMDEYQGCQREKRRHLPKKRLIHELSLTSSRRPAHGPHPK